MTTISNALGHGAFGFLVKPVEDEELLGSIRVAIDSIRSEAAP
jgi:FixJ family two-component response regulator